MLLSRFEIAREFYRKSRQKGYACDEFAENAQRKEFLPTEIEAIRRALLPIEAAAAKERQGTRSDLAPTSWKVSRTFGTTRDKIGAFAGVSGRQVEKIAKVVKAAEADPEKFGNLPAQMDDDGNVNAAYAQVVRSERHQAIARKPVMLDVEGTFPLIYADPPWPPEHQRNFR